MTEYTEFMDYERQDVQNVQRDTWQCLECGKHHWVTETICNCNGGDTPDAS